MRGQKSRPLPLSRDVAYTTACSLVQAVISNEFPKVVEFTNGSIIMWPIFNTAYHTVLLSDLDGDRLLLSVRIRHV